METATGERAVIIGTKVALSQLNALTEIDWVSNEMKQERYTTGRLGYFEGTELIEIPQAFENNDIGIEMCSDIVNGKYVITAQTKANTIELTKYLMNKYNIPASRLIRHYDVCGKQCPEPWGKSP